MYERALKVLADCGAGLSSEEFLDALWLATHLASAPADALARAGRKSAIPSDGDPPAEDLVDTVPGDADGHPGPSNIFPGARSRRSRGDLHGSPAAPATHGRTAVPPTVPAVSVRPPGEKALGTAELALGRALRPLRLHRPDPGRTELDVPRTVMTMAETGLPDVVLRSAKEQWLDLAILVDDGVSMLLWQRLATEVRLLMERSGAFRFIHTFSLDTHAPDGPLLGYRPFGTAPATLLPSAVLDPSGSTLLLVVSDGVGHAWRDGRMHDLLNRLAGVGPIAVLHTLPPRMWTGTGIQTERWRVTAHRPAAANRTWRVTDPVLPPEFRSFDGVPVPVLAPMSGLVATWARLVGSAGTSALLPLLTPSPSQARGVPRTADSDTNRAPNAVLERFRDVASTDAYRLAAHLAAVAPMPVPAMQLVRQALGPPVDSGHLAEIFLSGLLRRVGGTDRPPQQWQFDFAEGTRRILLGTVPPPELLRTARTITGRLAELSGRALSFLAWLPQPDGQEQVSAGQQAFTWVDARAMRRLGIPLPDTPAPPTTPPRYDLAIRTRHSPSTPPGLAARDVVIPWSSREETDPKSATIDTLRQMGLTLGDAAAKIVFIAPSGVKALPPYAAVVGFTHRWVDAYADGSVLELADSEPYSEGIGNVTKPDVILSWAQVGGPQTDGMLTVPFPPDPDGRLEETTAGVIHYAPRLRMVPPDSASAALRMLRRVAALRIKEKNWRFPVLSTGAEPLPVDKLTQGQGVDLELIRQAGEHYRREVVKAGETTEVVPVPQISPLNQRIAEANAADPARLLRRLGATSDDGLGWACPRNRGDHAHDALKVSAGGLISCKRCYPRRVGLVRLTMDTLLLTPDEAAAFILQDSGGHFPAPGMAVTARISGQVPGAYRCTVRDPVNGRVHEALLPEQELHQLGKSGPIRRLPEGETVVALVLDPSEDTRPGRLATSPRGPLVLSLTASALVERVLAGFVTELTTGQVAVMGIARVPGARTKIVAAPTRPTYSVKGAFIGKDAERKRGAQRLLFGNLTDEKIEIIVYSSDQRTLLVNALVFAEPTGIFIDGHRAVVAVPDDQIARAIGQGGLNARLAGELTDLYVQIVPSGTDLTSVTDPVSDGE
ncbi:SAV_2336 N-terminal domain-related protein [Streptomyces orinoci]|uniref:SAV_2336 N-terminal domain-related protein n=1 Tax=Streptomyces orinoci TaxID=67339 RepID=A0ABV3JYF8_STRON|nr:SAV_2336 N-terminal domain-related protein [Streptomyces orinoci]